ncbi:MAG: hypothetical protein ANABAC_2562 [Anaerolineae bacterium]|jgi:hypothetical protein|nr:MAG: hypothetical protein ANABAC_2562 [Anaerolineae bacterium]
MNPKTKLGLFYFPDDQHYHARERDKWIPELVSLGVSWLVLTKEDLIAIPEPFIQTLLNNCITPIIRMVNLPANTSKPPSEFELLVKTYADWGIQYIQLFDRPNNLSFWDLKSWAGNNLVEPFIDLFLPYAEVLIKYNIRPVFPCLEVARGFWDTAFLRLALESLKRRKHYWLIDTLILSGYVHLYDPSRPLNWGAGGQERWPNSKPYQTSPDSQDQRGLYIADWYQALARATFGKPLPILLLDDPACKPYDLAPAEIQQRTFHAIQRLLHPRSTEVIEIEGTRYEPLAEEILCLSFCGLPANDTDSESRAWYSLSGEPHPLVKKIKAYLGPNIDQNQHQHRIPHALLLPQLDADQLHDLLDKLKPFIIQYQPKITFTLEEAFEAGHVWIPAGSGLITEKEINAFEDHFCVIHTINPDGISIASQTNEPALEVP